MTDAIPAPTDVQTSGERLVVGSISVRYGGVVAVRDVSFEAAAGACTMILGANGAGKTSLLRGISGFERCGSETKVRIGDRVISDLDPARRAREGLAHCLQERNVFPNMSVRDNLVVAAEAANSAATVDEALAAFPDLEPLLASPAGSLSGGQQQFLAIARCLMLRPSVIMLDEPTNGLAPLLVEQVCDTVEELTARGLTVVVVEQRLELAPRLADQVLLMANGRVMNTLDGADPELEAKAQAVYLGDQPDGTRAPTGSPDDTTTDS